MRRVCPLVTLGVFLIGHCAGTAPAQPLPTFENVAERAGIRFQPTFGDDDMSSILEATGFGCAFLDYDGDGYLDIYFVNGHWLPGIPEVAAKAPRAPAPRRGIVPCALATLLCAGAGCQKRLPPARSGIAPLRLVITQVPLDALRTMNARFPEKLTPPLGSRIVRITPSSRAAQPTVLTPGFAAAADPCVSFSGDSILFAGTRTDGERWNIWRMSLLGDSAQAEATQVTYDMGDCREPFYMALGAITPPEFTDKVRWIGYTSTAPGTYDERGITPATALYCQSLDSIEGRGIVTWRTTFNLSHDFSPTMLGDGRVLFTSWRFGERKGERGTAGLLASNWDGTGLNPFFGVQDGAFVRAMACEFPEDRTVVFVESDGDAPLNAGSLARIRMARPLATHERISDAPGRFPHSARPAGR